jgi:hypothetical protein
MLLNTFVRIHVQHTPVVELLFQLSLVDPVNTSSWSTTKTITMSFLATSHCPGLSVLHPLSKNALFLFERILFHFCISIFVPQMFLLLRNQFVMSVVPTNSVFGLPWGPNASFQNTAKSIPRPQPYYLSFSLPLCRGICFLYTLDNAYTLVHCHNTLRIVRMLDIMPCSFSRAIFFKKSPILGSHTPPSWDVLSSHIVRISSNNVFADPIWSHHEPMRIWFLLAEQYYN